MYSGKNDDFSQSAVDGSLLSTDIKLSGCGFNYNGTTSVKYTVIIYGNYCYRSGGKMSTIYDIDIPLILPNSKAD